MSDSCCIYSIMIGYRVNAFEKKILSGLMVQSISMMDGHRKGYSFPLSLRLHIEFYYGKVRL